MKFSEIPYKRPDVDAMIEKINILTANFTKAESAEKQLEFFKEYENFWCVKLVGIGTGLILIPVLFYTYNGVIGKSPDWINIAIFFVSVAAAFFFETKLFKKDKLHCKYPLICFLAICLIGVLFIVFTFATPQIPLFLDPLTMTY